MPVRSRLPSNDSVLSRPYGQEKSVSSADRWMKVVKVSTASRDATSPALCPPMPSATAKRRSSGSETNWSSLVFRTRPVSDTPHARNTHNLAWGKAFAAPWVWGFRRVPNPRRPDNTTLVVVSGRYGQIPQFARRLSHVQVADNMIPSLPLVAGQARNHPDAHGGN